MDTTKVLIIGAVIILLGGIGWFAVSESKGDGAMMEKPTVAQAMEGKNEEVVADKGDTMMRKGSYEIYSPEKLALAASGDVLLFFHAAWCPICRGIESEINADMSKIPDGVHILKVDYDTAIALRQKYGVTVQHTFVQVDASGNALQKFNNASSLSGVLARIQ
ncbi:thioredoxin family protein [Candidatus Kaiserbacteria bacterium]|nr:thioredoxin family protein [Candidatus Kaiserbacteria bacterium]